MWRHLTRGLQQGLKRSLCLEKTDRPTCGIDGNNSVPLNKCWAKQLLPSAFEGFNYCIRKQRDGNQYEKEHYEKASRNIRDHTFLEAFGWSGALVFGWVISKQLWLKQTCQDKDRYSNNVLNESFIELLTRIVKTQPPVRSVLPQLQSTPIQVIKDGDEEFEAAAKEVQRIHEKAIGEALNRRGIACLSKSLNSEAIKYFQRASQFMYPAASFNMGQCCELGIGIEQDFEEAAKWYKIASDQGHATAMYNLGVFYAHGWGGLPSDIIVAKELFVRAGNLGQPDAISALEKESKSITSKLSNYSQLKPLNGSEINSDNSQTPSIECFLNKLRNEKVPVFQKRLPPETNWDFPFNTTVAF